MQLSVVLLTFVVAAHARSPLIEFINFKAPKIVNGGDASPGEWKWQASLQYSDTGSSFRHVCGACLIDANTVLTAAHCVDFDTNTAHFKVVLGDHTQSQNTGNEQTMGVASVTMHRSWNPNTIQNDIAVVKLSGSAQLNSHVQPIALPTANTDFSTTECWITGWGKTDGSNTGIPDVMQEVRVKTLSHSACRGRSIAHLLNLQQSMICVEGFSNDASACNGDSGGPLACKVGGTWTLGGITSWGLSGCPPNMPSVYTRVTSFVEWVAQNRN